MKNNVLWRVYLEQSILAMPAFWLLSYLWGNYRKNIGNEEYYEKYSVYITGMVLFFVVGITWYLMRKMRSEKRYSFVNALPVTKGQQITALAAVMLFLTIILTIIGEVQLYGFYECRITFGEILISILVKIAVVFCVNSLFIWFCSHWVPRFETLLLGILGLGICCGLLYGIFDILRKIFGMPGNNPLYMGWNLWSILTVPIQDFNRYETEGRKDDLSEWPSYLKGIDTTILTWEKKVVCALIFVACMLIAIQLFIRLARRNYQSGDLAKQRFHQPFHHIWKVVILCIVCGTFTGTVGSFLLQYNGETKVYIDTIPTVSVENVQDLIDSDTLCTVVSDITVRDFRGKKSYWGQEARYQGHFWRYQYYQTKSSTFAKVVAIVSIFSGVMVVLAIYGQRYHKKRGGERFE